MVETSKAQTGVGRYAWEREATSRTGAGAVTNPHDRYRDLRERGPVHASGIPALFGVPDPLQDVFGDRPHVSTYDFEHTDRVLRDSATFGNEGLRPLSERAYGVVSLQGTDGDAHRHYRLLLQPAFGRRGMPMWLAWLDQRLDGLIDEFVGRGKANLYFDYCARFPAWVIGKAFGVPDSDIEQFAEWAALLQTGAADATTVQAVSAQAGDYLRRLIARRRQSPAADLLSLVVHSDQLAAESEDVHPRDDQILGLVRNLMPAGVGTTYRTLGIVLVVLLERPDLMERITRDRMLVPRVVDEVLRWEPPVAWMLRVAKADTELGGLPIVRGTVVHAGIAAANRDPAVTPDPDTFDIDRPRTVHLSFSTGAHYCIGAQLARLEVETALNRLLDRLPNLRLDVAEERPVFTGLMFRMPTSVPARWDDISSERPE